MKAIHNDGALYDGLLAVVSDCKDTKLLKAIHNVGKVVFDGGRVVSDCKDTKLLKAIHNKYIKDQREVLLFQIAKILNF